MGEIPPPPPRHGTRSLVRVLGFLGRYPGQVSLSLSLLLVMIAIDMALPRIVGEAINNLRWHVEWDAAFNPWVWVQLYLALAATRSGLGIILGPIRNRLIQRTLTDIRSAIFDAMQRLPFQYHDKAKTGELISRSTTDVWRLQDFLFACLLLSADIAVSLLVTLVLIFLVSPALGFVALATVIPTVALISFFATKLQPRWRKVHDLHGAMTSVVQENIAGMRVVKAFAREAGEITKFRGKRDEFLGTLMNAVNYWASRVPLAQFIFGLSLPLVLWLGGGQVIRGDLAVGDLAAVVLYLMAIGHRVNQVGHFTEIVQNASASAERVLEIIHEPHPLKNGTIEPPPGKGEVRLENVSFSYGESKASLHDLSFVARAGQTVAIVGPTGSGKTTLVNLIPRFYDPTTGDIFLDGRNIKEMKLDSLRRQVGVIFQETFLFSATVAENIAYGNPNATRPEIEQAARLAQAHEFIAEHERGYDTVIGERGVSLSGGQKQRIAIARAFLMNPRVLILDDATASVDSRTERLIQEAMRQLAAGRTTFIIAHRMSSVKNADWILVLQDGRLVEQGRHADLIECGSHYRRIFERQLTP